MQLINQNNKNLISQISDFVTQFKNTGKDPEQMYKELISSGRFTPDQIKQAKLMAENAMKLFNK